MKTILYPTDFSACSAAVFPLACALARDRDARLVVLHVVPRMEPSPCCGGRIQPSEVFQEDLKSYRDEMYARLLRLQPPDARVIVEHVFEEGDPAKTILRTAEETACDLIVMGTHGRTGEFRLLMGSVAEQVSRKAPCPVMTLKAATGATIEPRSTETASAGV